MLLVSDEGKRIGNNHALHIIGDKYTLHIILVCNEVMDE